MKVTVERNDTLKVIALDGQLDVSSSDATRDSVISLLDGKPTIISMAKCTYVSSSGLRALLMIAKTAKSRGIMVVYAEAIEEVVDVLKMTGFIKMLNCADSIAEAERELNHAN